LIQIQTNKAHLNLERANVRPETRKEKRGRKKSLSELNHCVVGTCLTTEKRMSRHFQHRCGRWRLGDERCFTHCSKSTDVFHLLMHAFHMPITFFFNDILYLLKYKIALWSTWLQLKNHDENPKLSLDASLFIF
jgi:hypothetical protein